MVDRQTTRRSSSRKSKLMRNILVVDDNVILLRTVKEMLSEDYYVSIATSCAQAFEAVSFMKPELILLDYEMPFVDGEEALKQFRTNETTKDIPVIFFTGSAEKETVTKLLALKPDGYMLKPPNKQKLLTLIEKTLEI